MRSLIALGVVGLALGLAATWSPRVPQGEIPAQPVRETKAAVAAEVREAAAPSRPAASVATTAAEEGQPAPEPDGAVEPALVAKLVSAGFTENRALEILERENRLRREAVEREYAATGTVSGLNGASPVAIQQQLRKEMGDAEYEKYLGATGQTTRIRVAEVEADSLAANAGIQSGDEILSYAGQRVFNQRDLNALMLKTPEGRTVSATVVRDGHRIELYVTGGMLGIAQGAAR